MGDWELLQEYAEHRSEAAFAELVRRHLDWVYSAARRQVGDPHLAEDVTQAVFVLLARKAGSLRSGTILTGWLFRTTRFVAARAMRNEYRRKRREEAASTMNAITANSPDDIWNQLAPHLDQAVAALSKTDRAAILLRFYEKKSLREVGEQLGLSEEAAKKRVSRAVEKMREFLTRRGVALGGTILVGVLVEQTVQAAPATLAVTALKAAMAGTSASAVLPALARETLNTWRLSRLGGIAAGIAAVAVTGVVLTVNLTPSREHNAIPPTGVAPILRAADSGVVSKQQQETGTPAQTEPATNRTIHIHVVDQQTKQPLTGVEIGVEIEKEKLTGHTDEEGRYELELPKKDPLRLTVAAHRDGFVPLWVSWAVNRGAFRLPEEFTFPFEPATSIGGVIRDEQGNPVNGAVIAVWVWGAERNGEVRMDTRAFTKPTTDSFGRWRFDQAPADLSTLLFKLSHPDYPSDFYPHYPYNDSPPDDKLREKTAALVLRRGTVIEGVVLNGSGQSIQGALVVQGEYTGRGATETNTDAAGRFRFTNVPRESIPFTAQAESYAPDLKLVEVENENKPLEFRLTKAHTIRGQVVDANGKPITGARVEVSTWRQRRVFEWHASTEADGTFEWSNGPADQVRFHFIKEGYDSLFAIPLRPDVVSSVVTLMPPSAAQSPVTDSEAAVQGIVRSPNGQPVENAQVFLETAAQPLIVRNGHARDPVHTTSDGRFKFSAPGKPFIVVALHDQGYAQGAAEHAGALPDLVLVPWARVEGIMRFGSRLAVGEKVHLSTDILADENMPRVWFEAETTCDDTGHFVLNRVPADNVSVGRWICLNKQSLSFTMTHSVHVQTKPGETAQVVIGSAGRPVIGRLVGPTGLERKIDWRESSARLHTPISPQPSVPENWRTMSDEQKRVWFDANSGELTAFQQAIQSAVHYPFAVLPDGSFRVEDIPPGAYQLEITMSAPRADGPPIPGQPIASLKHDLTVPKIPDGRTDEPLDLGELELKLVEPQK